MYMYVSDDDRVAFVSSHFHHLVAKVKSLTFGQFTIIIGRFTCFIYSNRFISVLGIPVICAFNKIPRQSIYEDPLGHTKSQHRNRTTHNP